MLVRARPCLSVWLFWLAFAVALIARLAWLGIRPLHHDEGVNAWFLNDLLQGRPYRYNPEAFHGPFLYLFGWLPGKLLGVGAVALRLPVALTSACMIPLLLPLRRRLGASGVTGAAWLLALSPSLICYGRDLIHETYLAFFTLALVVAASLWLETRRRRDFLLAAASAAFLFTIKETAVLTVASLGISALVAGWATLRLQRTSQEKDWKDWIPGRRDLALAAVLFAAIWIVFFTTLFTNPGGLADSFRAFLPWLQKGAQGSGHEKPWTYFPKLLAAFEAPTVLCGLAGAVLAVRRRDPFGLFCAVWAATQLLLYSAIPYKTPWLDLNIVLPGALAAGCLFRELAARPLPVRATAAAVLAAGLSWCAWRAADVAVRRFDDSSLGLVYSDTSRDVWNLLAFLRAAIARAPDPDEVTLVTYLSSRWPLPWYLRDLEHTLWKADVHGEPTEDILLADPSQDKVLNPLLTRGYRRKEFLLRPSVPIEVWVRAELWPEQ